MCPAFLDFAWPLMITTEKGKAAYAQTLEILLAAGADPNARVISYVIFFYDT